MFKIENVSNPRWADKQKTRINCDIKCAGLKKEVPFTASLFDPEEHGRRIFLLCRAGFYGDVAEHEPSAYNLKDGGTGHSSSQHTVNWPDLENFLQQANIENTSGTTRGIVLVWSSMVEELLGRLLEAFLIESSEAKALIWDDAHSSLKSLSGRAKVCFALGLISKRDLTICDKIRAIRNGVAHEWDLRMDGTKFANKATNAFKALYDLDHSELWIWKQDDLRTMTVRYYASSCAMLSFRLANRVVDVGRERRAKLADF